MHSRLKYVWRMLGGGRKKNSHARQQLTRLVGFDNSSTADYLQGDKGTTSPTIETAQFGSENPKPDHPQSKRENGAISIVAVALREREW